MWDYIPVLAAALAFAATGTPLARRLALRTGMVDQPNTRKVHTVPTPLLGGLAIYIAFVLSVFLVWDRVSASQMVAILVGATVVAALGFLDDSGKLHPQVKLLFGMPLAATMLIVSGVQFTFFHQPILDILFTLFWVVGITAALNLMDNMDGLAAGVSAIASFFFLYLAASGEQYLVGTLAAAAMGAALGFLRYNFNPAQIFMGDGGALFLGFMLAVLGLKIRFPAQIEAVGWTVPILVLGIPILDTSLVTLSRLRRGLNPTSSPGKDHLSHRLVAIGLSPRLAVALIYLLSISLGILAVLVSESGSPVVALGLFILLVLAAFIAIVSLEGVEFEGKTPGGSHLTDPKDEDLIEGTK